MRRKSNVHAPPLDPPFFGMGAGSKTGSVIITAAADYAAEAEDIAQRHELSLANGLCGGRRITVQSGALRFKGR